MANLYRVDETGRIQLVCGVKHDDWVINVAFSPDGSRAVSDDRGEDGVKLWSTEACELIDKPFKMELGRPKHCAQPRGRSDRLVDEREDPLARAP